MVESYCFQARRYEKQMLLQIEAIEKAAEYDCLSSARLNGYIVLIESTSQHLENLLGPALPGDAASGAPKA